MADMPDNVDLNWIARRLLALQDDTRALRADMDMLTRMVVRMDHTLDAVPEDIRSLWSSQGDLRPRIEMTIPSRCKLLQGRAPWLNAPPRREGWNDGRQYDSRSDTVNL